MSRRLCVRYFKRWWCPYVVYILGGGRFCSTFLRLRLPCTLPVIQCSGKLLVGNIKSVNSFVLQFHQTPDTKLRLDIPAKMLFFCAFSLLCLHVTSYSLGRHSLRMGTGNSFGKLFKISTFGESHGKGVGVIIDGCPPRVAISSEEIQCELDRRRPGQSRLTTPRKEADIVEILSGVADGISLGTPIALLVPNTNQRGGDYDTMSNVYRPSHADATYDAKYGVRAIAGGGRASARETVARVAAGAIAKKILTQYCGLEIVGYVQSVHNVSTFDVDHDLVTRDEVCFSVWHWNGMILNL